MSRYLCCAGYMPCSGTFSAFHGNCRCLVKDHVDSSDQDKVKQKHLFYQLFSVYLKENCKRGIVRPVPVLLGDGQLLDLYQLFSLVKERGGYVVVSRKGLWDYVTKELGLDLQILASVKLVYDKYLNDFEGWLRKTIEENSLKNGNHGCDWGFKSLPLDLEKEFRSLLWLNLKDKDDDFVRLESNNIIKHIDLINHKSDTNVLDTKNQNNKCEDVQHVDGDGNDGDDEKISNGVKDDLAASGNNQNNKCEDVQHVDGDGNDGDDEKISNGVKDDLAASGNNQNNKCEDVQHVDDGNDGDDEKISNGVKDDLAAFGEEIAGKEYNTRKRKRETLSGVLNWIRHIATHPLDPVARPIPKPSNWKEYKGQDFFVQMLKARDVLLLKQYVEPNGGSSSQKLKMHPDMYEDDVALGHRGTVKLRCSERLPLSAKSRCSCFNSCSANGNRLPSSVNMEVEKCPLDKTTAELDSVAEEIKSDPAGDDFLGKHVSIGPLFQAEVPQWTGAVYESDPKWLGTQVWPVKHDSKSATETDLIGRERQEKCSCYVQGSVECVRFHIAENRMKLKLELGSVFYQWGFDQMGEEVSLRWTTDEEKKFKDLMRSQVPSQNKSFWINPSKYFRKKTRKNLVSYYFNVFLIQLRSYQNRVTPKSVDSDDEAEFGSFSGFGMKAIKGPATDFLACSVNRQCTDFE